MMQAWLPIRNRILLYISNKQFLISFALKSTAAIVLWSEAVSLDFLFYLIHYLQLISLY